MKDKRACECMTKGFRCGDAGTLRLSSTRGNDGLGAGRARQRTVQFHITPLILAYRGASADCVPTSYEN